MKKNLNEKNGAGDAGEVKEADPIFEKFGPPFVTDTSGNPKLNQVAIAAKCAAELQLEFNPTRKEYIQYAPTSGLWQPVNEVEVRRRLNELLLRLGTEYDHEDVVRRATYSAHRSLAQMLQHVHDVLETEATTGLVHVANGVLDLRRDEVVLLPHDPKFRFFASAGIRFDEHAKCPRFEKELLGAALTPDDIKLLQLVIASILLGANISHLILLIRGGGGTGKSTLLWIIERIIGEHAVAHLRTNHLLGRFESSAFIGKRMLVGSDVPGDTLKEKGARLLKSLTGGDLLEAEFKYVAAKKQIRGDFHVVLTSNGRLRIALEGDEEAWRRRLVVVDFDGQKPAHPIPSFADILVREEGSGILNWLVAGAVAFRKVLQETGTLPLTKTQRERIDELLTESDNVRSFVRERLVADRNSTVTSDELLRAYLDFCEQRTVEPVGVYAFQCRAPLVLLDVLRVHRRNDIPHNGKAARGYRGVRLC